MLMKSLFKVPAGNCPWSSGRSLTSAGQSGDGSEARGHPGLMGSYVRCRLALSLSIMRISNLS